MIALPGSSWPAEDFLRADLAASKLSPHAHPGHRVIGTTASSENQVSARLSRCATSAPRGVLCRPVRSGLAIGTREPPRLTKAALLSPVVDMHLPRPTAMPSPPLESRATPNKGTDCPARGTRLLLLPFLARRRNQRPGPSLTTQPAWCVAPRRDTRQDERDRHIYGDPAINKENPGPWPILMWQKWAGARVVPVRWPLVSRCPLSGRK